MYNLRVLLSVVTLWFLGKWMYKRYLGFRKRHQFATAIGWCVVSWGIFAFLIAAMFGCASVRYVSAPVYWQPVPDSARALAYTNCDSANHPYIVVDTARVNRLLYPLVMTHELRHVRQLAEFGSCKEGLKWYSSDPNHRLAWEMQAECAEIAAGHPADEMFAEAIADRVRLYQSLSWTPKMTDDALAAKFLATCKGGNNVEHPLPP